VLDQGGAKGTAFGRCQEIDEAILKVTLPRLTL